jgi:stage II sporulation protein D
MVRPGLILVIWVVLAVLVQSCAWLGPPPHAHPGDSSDQSSEHSSHKSHSTPPPDTGLMRQDSTHRWNIEFLEMAFEHSTATDSALTSTVHANESSTTHSSQDLPTFSDAPLPSLTSPYANKPVRILLLEGNQSISISGTQLHIQSSNSPGIVISGTVKVSAMNNQIFMHNPAGKLITKVNHSQELRISSLGSSPSAPKPASFLQVNGKPYRGSIYFFTSPKGLQTINYVNMEDYLKGVVPHEIGTLEAWGNEALKAQAIAARTYAYKHLGTRPGQNFDFICRHP